MKIFGAGVLLLMNCALILGVVFGGCAKGCSLECDLDGKNCRYSCEAAESE